MCSVPNPCAAIPDSSTAAFTFVHTDTHFDPHSLPSPQEGQLFFKSWKATPQPWRISTSHDLHQQLFQGASMSSGKIFLSKLTQACWGELTDNLFYCTSVEAEMLHKFPHKYFTLHSAHSIPFPSPAVTVQNKNLTVFTFKLSVPWFQ